jgi:hypothetical protein
MAQGVLGGIMKNRTTLLGYGGLFMAVLSMGSQAEAYTNLNMGLSLNSGSAFGAPMFGYGGAAGSFGALNGCMNQGGFIGGPGGFGGGGLMGGNLGLPPPPRLIPPHLQGGGYFGGGMMGSPYLPGGSPCMNFCQPTYAYAQPPMMGPVQGGPMLGGGGGMMMASAGGSASSSSGSNVSSISGHGTTVIDLRPKVEDNTGDIIWAAALGIGMQAPNVYPFAGERGTPTNFGNFFYQEGNRDWSLQGRPHASP